MARRVRIRRKLRVLVLMHQDLVPPDDTEGLTKEDLAEFQTESDVVNGLAAVRAGGAGRKAGQAERE